MSELKLVSPLLDQMSVEEEIAGHNGCTCYALRHVQSGERFVVKRISVPASDLQVRALILSGAYPDDAAVHAYYGSVAEDIKMSSTPACVWQRTAILRARALTRSSRKRAASATMSISSIRAWSRCAPSSTTAP